MMIRSMALIMLLFGFGLIAEAAGPDAGLATAVVMAAQTDDVEGATPADRSPLEDLNPAESTWQVWLGPIAIGVFALILALLIRRFSMGSRNRPRGVDNDQSSSKDDQSSGK